MANREAETGFRVPQGDERLDPLSRAIRDPSFPASVRGYDRRAVDHYVERVNRLIAELEVSGSPRAAVRHALERVGEQTTGILQRARETAEEITSSAREEAEEATARARADGDEIVTAAQREAGGAVDRANAEVHEIISDAQSKAEEMLRSAQHESESAVARARVDAEGRIRRSEEEIAMLQEQATAQMHSLQADIAAISDERRRLLDELRRMAVRLDEIVAETEPASDVT